MTMSHLERQQRQKKRRRQTRSEHHQGRMPVRFAPRVYRR